MHLKTYLSNTVRNSPSVKSSDWMFHKIKRDIKKSLGFVAIVVAEVLWQTLFLPVSQETPLEKLEKFGQMRAGQALFSDFVAKGVEHPGMLVRSYGT
ncbi:hypothetical protein M0804_007781 [Polistes exclamans]|nr:hypothetical protein M0804_007781 [Polistes exclamans]